MREHEERLRVLLAHLETEPPGIAPLTVERAQRYLDAALLAAREEGARLALEAAARALEEAPCGTDNQERLARRLAFRVRALSPSTIARGEEP